MLGGVIERGESHRRVIETLQPGFDPELGLEERQQVRVPDEFEVSHLIRMCRVASRRCARVA